jgi:hypothetical protein
MFRSAYRLLPAACCLLSAGCYDSAVMLERVRNAALKQQLEEVDLGEYQVSLPRRLDSGEAVEIVIHMVGQLPRYRVKEVSKLLEEKLFLIRSETVMTLRNCPPEELTEPDLAQLKARLLKLTNDALGEKLVEDVVLREFGFSRG